MDRKPKAEVEKRSSFKFRSWKKLYKRCLHLRFNSLFQLIWSRRLCEARLPRLVKFCFLMLTVLVHWQRLWTIKKGLPQLLIHLMEISEYSHLRWRLPRQTIARRLTANNSWTTRGERRRPSVVRMGKIFHKANFDIVPPGGSGRLQSTLLLPWRDFIPVLAFLSE